MKFFERFIQYLAITGVFFAALYVVFPDFTDLLISRYGAIFGPLIVVGVFILAWRQRNKQTSKQ